MRGAAEHTGAFAPPPVDDPHSIVVRTVEDLLDHWPELRTALETDPVHGEWRWNSAFARYVPHHDKPASPS